MLWLLEMKYHDSGLPRSVAEAGGGLCAVWAGDAMYDNSVGRSGGCASDAGVTVAVVEWNDAIAAV